MSYSFTKSTNGRRFRLLHKTHHQRPVETYVEIQYATVPQFEDQVFGDIVRKMQREFPKLGYGLRARKATVDPALDAVADSALPGGFAGTRAVPALERPVPVDDVAQALLDAGVSTDADDDRVFAEHVASLLKQKFTITRKEES